MCVGLIMELSSEHAYSVNFKVTLVLFQGNN